MDSAELDRKIDALADTLREPLFFGPKRDGEYWRGVWSQIRDIGQSFRAVRYPAKNDKDAAWKRFTAIVEDVKRQREERDAQRKSRDEESQRLLAEILSKAQGGWPHEDGFMEFLGLITGAKLYAEMVVFLFEVMATILTFGLLTPGERDPQRAKLMACSTELKAAWSLFKSYKDDLLPQHREAAYKSLVGIQGELDNEWTKWKEEQRERHEQREQYFVSNREAKKELISEAKSLIGSHRDAGSRQRAKELFREWRAIKSAGRDHDDNLWEEFRGALDRFWEEGKEDQRERIESEIEKVKGMIAKARANRDANEERLESARSEEYADRVREWIEQGNADIEKFEGWLDDWEEKLRKLDD